MTPLFVRKAMQKTVRRIWAFSVVFLLKIVSGNPKDAGVNIALVDPGNLLCHDTVSPRSAHQSLTSPIKGDSSGKWQGFKSRSRATRNQSRSTRNFVDNIFFANQWIEATLRSTALAHSDLCTNLVFLMCLTGATRANLVFLNKFRSIFGEKKIRIEKRSQSPVSRTRTLRHVWTGPGLW